MALATRVLSLSEEEVELLERLDRMQAGARLVSRTLRATPLLQILTSTTPTSLLITVATNEWDKISESLQALSRIEACSIRDVILMWTLEHPYSSSESQALFSTLLSSANDKCV